MRTWKTEQELRKHDHLNRTAVMLFLMGVILEALAIGVYHTSWPGPHVVLDECLSLTASCFLLASAILILRRFGRVTWIAGLAAILLILSKFINVTGNIDGFDGVFLLGETVTSETWNRPVEDTAFAAGMFLLVASFLLSALESHRARLDVSAKHAALLRETEERKRREKELRESEERYRALFESSRDAIMTLEPPSWNFTSGNPSAVEMFGARDETDFVTRAPWDYSPEYQSDGEPSVKKARAIIETAMRAGSHYFEWTHKRVNGEEFPASVLLTLMKLEERTFLQATVRDITEQKLAEKAVRQKERFQVALLNDMHTFVGILEPNGDIIFVNNTPLKVRGIELEDIRGKKFYDAPWWTHSDATRETVKRDVMQCAAGQTLAHDIQIETADGSLMWIEYSMHPVFDEDGNVQFLVPEGRDLTERKQLEEEKLALAQQVQQAQKMEAMGVLAGGIAHNLRNSLGSILGWIEIAADNVTDDGVIRTSLNHATNTGRRAADLVKQLLKFSRVTQPTSRPIRLGPVVKEGLEILRGLLPATVEFRTKIDEDFGYVMGDASEIQQVIVNLGTNASHAMKGNGVLEVVLAEVEIAPEDAEMHLDLEEGKYAQLSVSDTGHGMSEETLARIFEPFFTTKGPEEGTGLGLSVAHGIVKGLGGKIEAKSEIGRGTTFYVFLPVCAGQEATFDEPVEAQIQSGHQDSCRILLVDDDEDFCEMTRTGLESLGFYVESHVNATEAMVSFRTRPFEFDVVIADQLMPTATGLELANIVHQIRSDMVIILLTGIAEMIDDQKAKDMGISELIVKPATPRELANAIRRVLDATQTGQT